MDDLTLSAIWKARRVMVEIKVLEPIGLDEADHLRRLDAGLAFLEEGDVVDRSTVIAWLRDVTGHTGDGESVEAQTYDLYADMLLDALGVSVPSGVIDVQVEED